MGSAPRICAIILAAAAAGCFRMTGPCGPDAQRGVSEIAPGVRVAAVPLADALLSQTGVVVQAVSGEVRGSPFSAECVMKSDGAKFTAVFLSGQARIATLAYSRESGVAWMPGARIPAAAGPANCLFDIACVNLPADALRRALGCGFRVEEEGGVRRVSSASGMAVAEIVRGVTGAIEYRNAALGYGYSVRRTEQE